MLKETTIVNKEGAEHRFPYANLHAVLFNLRDEDFEKIEHDYRKYIISRLHDPKEWDESMERVLKTAKKMNSKKEKPKKR
jgi:hypothetical protein